MAQTTDVDRPLIISYLTLRKAVGILGVALPFVVSIGAWILSGAGLKGSISSYYYSVMHDVFVGILWAIGVFLISYKGYTDGDNIAADLGGAFAIGVSLFPTSPEPGPTTVIGGLHFAFAAGFFVTLIYFSGFLFTRSDQDVLPQPKQRRNRVYRLCAWMMSVCIVLILIYKLLPADTAAPFKSLNPIFWLEALAIVAFGVSWLTKGEAITLLND